MGLAERVVRRYAGSLKTGYLGTLAVWGLVSAAQRALAGIEHGNVYDNLKSLASVFSSLDRSDPPIEVSVVREGHDLSRRILVAERMLLGVLVDANNLFTVLERVEHQADHKLASSGYGPHFHKIVECVDALNEGLKKIPQAKAAVEEVKKLIERDPDVEALPGLNKYAPVQKCEFLEKGLKDVEQSVQDLIQEYDAANSSFLRMGLR